MDFKVLAVGDVVGVRGAGKVAELAVVFAVGVGVGYEDAQGSSRGATFKYSADDAVFVCLDPFGGYSSRWASFSQLSGYKVAVNGYSGGESVDDRAYLASMALSKEGHAYVMSECVFHFRPFLSFILSMSR